MTGWSPVATSLAATPLYSQRDTEGSGCALAAVAPARRTVRSALGVYAERPALVMVALGFSAGLPYFLIFDTLSAWLRASGLSLEVIGFFSLVTLVSSFKFLWAPFVDREKYLVTGWLGHRRSWMLVCQG